MAARINSKTALRLCFKKTGFVECVVKMSIISSAVSVTISSTAQSRFIFSVFVGLHGGRTDMSLQIPVRSTVEQSFFGGLRLIRFPLSSVADKFQSNFETDTWHRAQVEDFHLKPSTVFS